MNNYTCKLSASLPQVAAYKVFCPHIQKTIANTVSDYGDSKPKDMTEQQGGGMTQEPREENQE